MDTERLQTISIGNKKRLNSFIEIIKETSELTGFNRLTRIVKIPISTLNQNNLSQVEAEQLCTLINGITRETIIDLPVRKADKHIGGADDFIPDSSIKRLASLQKIKFDKIIMAEQQLSLLGITDYDRDTFLILQFISADGLQQVFSMQKYIDSQNESDTQLDDATKKKLGILKKLKVEWELMPKGFKNKQIKISDDKWQDWIRESGVDEYYQLENILFSLQEEGLIIEYDFIDNYR
ncbi:MAG: hypothetical protein JWN37_506 [Candidatus Nomurabacteria bacterium]|nr:hypothetical protein [Candidatus Nomurabacteria bacterium]